MIGLGTFASCALGIYFGRDEKLTHQTYQT